MVARAAFHKMSSGGVPVFYSSIRTFESVSAVAEARQACRLLFPDYRYAGNLRDRVASEYMGSAEPLAIFLRLNQVYSTASSVPYRNCNQYQESFEKQENHV